MSKPDIIIVDGHVIIVDGHVFSWGRLVELRRAQLEAWRAAQPRQLALFELKHDCRPQAERTAAGRYQEPSLFAAISDPRSS